MEKAVFYVFLKAVLELTPLGFVSLSSGVILKLPWSYFSPKSVRTRHKAQVADEHGTVTVQCWCVSEHRGEKATQLLLMDRRQRSLETFYHQNTRVQVEKKLQVTAVCYMNKPYFAQEIKIEVLWPLILHIKDFFLWAT